MNWQLKTAAVGTEADSLLEAGWEPFAVTHEPETPYTTKADVVWFRKQEKKSVKEKSQ